MKDGGRDAPYFTGDFSAAGSSHLKAAMLRYIKSSGNKQMKNPFGQLSIEKKMEKRLRACTHEYLNVRLACIAYEHQVLLLKAEMRYLIEELSAFQEKRESSK